MMISHLPQVLLVHGILETRDPHVVGVPACAHKMSSGVKWWVLINSKQCKASGVAALEVMVKGVRTNLFGLWIQLRGEPLDELAKPPVTLFSDGVIRDCPPAPDSVSTAYT